MRGRVVSVKMVHSASVLIEGKKTHPLYKKSFVWSKKYLVDDPFGVKKGDVVNTIIHEKLHAQYPKMSHENIYKNASKIESSMSLPEMAIELLQTHERSLNPPPYKREMVYSEVSNIISRNIN